jgi:glycosyltransferase involved in cell wall biosynthesis
VSEGLTIAVPFHRRPDYLEVAIESVLAQEERGWRLLVVDDGGSDQGVEELLRARGDERIRYHRNPGNLGMVPTWNHCLDLAETELVTLLHADDRLGPGYVGLMLDLAARFPTAAAFCCEAEIIDEGGARTFSLADTAKALYRPGGDPLQLEGEPGLSAVMAGNFIMCPTLCYRLPVLNGRRFSDDWKQVQDLEFTSELLLAGKTLVCSRARQYAYRRHAEGATALQNESRLRFDEEFRLFDRVADRADERGWRDAARVARSKRVVRLHLAWRAARELVSLRPRRALEWLRYSGEE